MAATKMKKIQGDAQKRRAKLVAEQERLKWTITRMAEKYGLTPVRMGQLLKKARAERLAKNDLPTT